MTKRIKKALILLLTLIVVSFTNIVSAESDSDRREECRKPRFRSIKPPHLSEVAPGSVISFTLPTWSDPNKVDVTVKKLKAVTIVEDHNSFYLVKVTLPAELVNTYARVTVIAYAKIGCHIRNGWLYKITGSEQEPKIELKNDQQPVADLEAKSKTQ